MAFHLKIVSADKTLVDENVLTFKTKNLDGEYQILTNHSPIVMLTKSGKSEYVTLDSQKKEVETLDGLLRFKDNSLILITESSEEVEDLD